MRLDHDEQIALLRRWRATGDRQAFATLHHSLQGLVAMVARRYANIADFDDLMQEGSIALVRALEKFNPDIGSRLSSYVVPWIWRDVQLYASRYTCAIKPTVRTREHIADVVEFSKSVISLDHQIYADKTRLETLESSDPMPGATLEERQIKQALWRALHRLDERERGIIIDRFLSADEPTRKEIGVRYQVSGEMIRKLETRAIGKLRRAMARVA